MSIQKTIEHGTVSVKLMSCWTCQCMLSSTTTKRHHYGAPYTLFFSVAPANQLLRPYDCRMWTALATVYEGLQRSLRMLPFVKEADAKDPDSPMRSKHTLAHSSEQTGSKPPRSSRNSQLSTPPSHEGPFPLKR